MGHTSMGLQKLRGPRAPLPKSVPDYNYAKNVDKQALQA